jgi:hypothetical protein
MQCKEVPSYAIWNFHNTEHTRYSLLGHNTMEIGSIPVLCRKTRPASNSMATSLFVSATDAMSLNIFLFHYSFTKTSKVGAWGVVQDRAPQDTWETVCSSKTLVPTYPATYSVMTRNTSVWITNNCPTIFYNMANALNLRHKKQDGAHTLSWHIFLYQKTINGKKEIIQSLYSNLSLPSVP